MIGKILVFIQFTLIVLISMPYNKTITYPFLGVIIILIGIVIGLLALNVNRRENFNITPYIKSNCKLITYGIYKYIRHPMYLSVLLSMFGFVIFYFDKYDTILYSILVVNMLIKMFYEEHLWNCQSLNYKQYCSCTKRLIPFIF